MPYDLKGRKVLVTGGSRGLGELVCLKFATEGCDVAINYVSSESRAIGVKERIEQETGQKGLIVQGDMGKEEDCTRVVQEAITQLGGLDIIVSNAGYTRFSEFADINSTTNEDWDLCYAINVKAQLYLMRAAKSVFESNRDGGVFIITSSIAGRNPNGSSMPYSVTKAAQLHLMRCLARSEGPKTRVNAILPGLLMTEWGVKYTKEAIAHMNEVASLKKDTDLHDAANAYLDTARNTSMTGQKIQIDSGLGMND